MGGMQGPLVIVPKSMPVKYGEIAKALGKAGFPLVEAPPFTQGSRMMFNRGLNGGSNYFILVETAADRLRAFMINPADSREASFLPKKHLIVSVGKGFSGMAKFCDDVVAAALHQSEKKPKSTYFLQAHYHLGSIGETGLNVIEGMRDDGLSSFEDCAVLLALNNADFAAQTMHNNFSLGLFRHMERVLGSAGISAIAGIEATMPVFSHEPWLRKIGYNVDANPNPNGPHVLLLATRPGALQEIVAQSFSKRPYEYAPCAADCADMGHVLENIRKGRQGESIAIIAAHPTCEGVLPQVGILDRMMYGEISVERTISMIKKYFDALACFNSTLRPSDEVDFGRIREEIARAFEGKLDVEFRKRMKNINHAEEYLKSIVSKWGVKYGRNLSRNTINMAFSAEMSERHGKRRIFEPDSHRQTLPYRNFPLAGAVWVNGVGGFGTGHTNVITGRKSQKPTVAQVINTLRGKNGKIEIDPRVYATMSDDRMMIPPQRTEGSYVEKALDFGRKLLAYITRQGPVLLKDAWKSAFGRKNGQADLHSLERIGHGSAYYP